tara:strand:- start:205 stop:897 length:693 start_codon:yes stop_codon:yes gene_type:complete
MTEKEAPKSIPGSMSFADAKKNLKKKLQKDRAVCLMIASVRSSMENKPKSPIKYATEFKNSLLKQGEDTKAAVGQYLQLASKIDQVNPKREALEATLAVCKASVPRTEWKGKWSDVDLCWVGEGKFAGEPKPQDHAPKWWQNSGYLSGDKYLASLAKVNSFNQLCRELWFIVPDNNPASLKKEIKSIHKDFNAWCERNNKAALPLPPNRSSFLTKKQTEKYIKAGLIRGI